MKCPECGEDALKVTHTYGAGETSMTQRRECMACGCVATAIVILSAVNPKRGEGAHSMAEKMKEKTPRLEGLGD